MNRASTVLLLALALAACDGGTTTTDDAGAQPDATTPIDGGEPVDGGELADATTPPGDGGGDVDGGTPAGCGTERPDISGITGTEGLVIARDGTIYYSQRRAVGRLAPGGAPENAFVALAGANTVWGLALDAANDTLYAGSPTTGTIYAIDLTAATPVATAWLTGAGGPNGLTMGPDGAVYYSDFGGGHVYRVPTGTPTGTRAQVTTSTIAQANGVTFLPDGTLLVASYATGTIHQLTLTAGAETARTNYATDTGSPDGLALDADGRLYVGDNAGRLLRVDAAGATPMVLRGSISAAANVEFGAGPLNCQDIYVASGAALVRYEMGTTAGAAVLWH